MANQHTESGLPAGVQAIPASGSLPANDGSGAAATQTSSQQQTPAAPGALVPPGNMGMELLHLASLNALTIAQPLLDRLEHNPGYIVLVRLNATDLILIATALLVGLPILWALPSWLAGLWGGAVWRRRMHLAAMGLLFTILSVSVLNWCSVEIETRRYGMPGVLVVAAAAAVAYGLWRNYVRRGWVASTLTVAGVGLLVFPWSFFTSSHVAAICFPRPSAIAPESLHARNPVPVVMIVFDGFSSMALLNAEHTIDAVRYPNFARLAQTSTWYRDATTMFHRTGNAIPSILTGRLPLREAPPVLSAYPDNLFWLLHHGQQYELTVFEPFTRLCPDELRFLGPKQTTGQRFANAMYTLACVYIDVNIPHDTFPSRPEIPQEWMRLTGDRVLTDQRTGLMIYSWGASRLEQFEHFNACLRSTDHPTFQYLHIVLPHDPWLYLPSGHEYTEDANLLGFPPGAHGQIGEDWGPDSWATDVAWQRYLLQLQCVDRYIGKMLDRMEAVGLLDRALLVITADHGLAFTPGLPRREPRPQTLPALLPVPLFIKYPGQTRGVIDDRNVEIIDILPTIADVIELDLPGRVDGASLIDPREAPRPRKTLILEHGGELPLAPDFPEKYQYVDDMLRKFGTGGPDDRLRRLSLKPEWLGRPLSDFRIGPPSQVALELTGGGDVTSPNYVPCYLEGVVSGLQRLPVTLAVSLNGRIAQVTRTLQDPQASDCWMAMLDETLFDLRDSQLEFFEVREASGQPPELRPCQWVSGSTARMRFSNPAARELD